MVGQHGITQGHTHVAQNGRVGQISLPAADGQFFTQVAQQCVGQAQVAFGIFKVNRIDLVRHGGGADLTVFEALLEIANADVAPDVAGKVDQNGVATSHGVEQLGHVVMRLDLNAVGLKSQTQAPCTRVALGLRLRAFNHPAAKALPVKVRPG